MKSNQSFQAWASYVLHGHCQSPLKEIKWTKKKKKNSLESVTGKLQWKKQINSQMPYLYTSILYHGLFCPFTAKFAIIFNVFTMGLHVKLMLYLSFHCNLPYMHISCSRIKKSQNLHWKNRSWSSLNKCLCIHLKYLI